jgi:hypothetical protein
VTALCGLAAVIRDVFLAPVCRERPVPHAGPSDTADAAA